MSATAPQEPGPAIMDLWHPVAILDDLRAGETTPTQLLDRDIAVSLDGEGAPLAWLIGEEPPGAPTTSDLLPAIAAYEFAWTSLGSPPGEIFAIPECEEPDRRNLATFSVGVHVSAPRAVENFLDLGHFPYVHAGILGQVPRTEVLDYTVEVDPETNELWARDCEFFQPQAAAASTDGQMSQYTYRVPHPHCVMLYKSCPTDESRFDVIALFCQALSADRVLFHTFMSVIDEVSSDAQIRAFIAGCASRPASTTGPNSSASTTAGATPIATGTAPTSRLRRTARTRLLTGAAPPEHVDGSRVEAITHKWDAQREIHTLRGSLGRIVT